MTIEATTGNEDFANLIAKIEAAAATIHASPSIDSQMLAQLRRAVGRLSECLEPTRERIMRSIDHAHERAFIRLALDSGILGLFTDPNHPGVELGVDEISALTHVDQALTTRVLRVLVQMGILDTTPEGLCKGNQVTLQFVPGNELHAHFTFSRFNEMAFAQLPEYLKERGYRNPDNLESTPFHKAFQTSLSFWDWLAAHQPEYDAFHRLMTLGASHQTINWTEYVAQERWDQLLDDQPDSRRGERPFTLVDVGGGNGHEVTVFLNRFPELRETGRSRLIVEDLSPPAATIATTKGPSPSGVIERMQHSFFDPQPVHGADIYLLARVLHNWPDCQARTILDSLAHAMAPESVLFIFDRVFPDRPRKESLRDVSLDLSMMVLFSALERSEAQFQTLLDEVGLRLIRVWREHGQGDALGTMAILEVKRTVRKEKGSQ